MGKIGVRAFRFYIIRVLWWEWYGRVTMAWGTFLFLHIVGRCWGCSTSRRTSLEFERYKRIYDSSGKWERVGKIYWGARTNNGYNFLMLLKSWTSPRRAFVFHWGVVAVSISTWRFSVLDILRMPKYPLLTLRRRVRCPKFLVRHIFRTIVNRMVSKVRYLGRVYGHTLGSKYRVCKVTTRYF